ncbi:hypothetical protein [Natronoglomus mannanivorans]|uniref:Uncharacterized protein n=1 Tax=Natronoglomus mannanivorans TaxID=2979990 RepID=A0AAP2Z373_9EURY|nr:hypothetical protein [Halobacteria archaeon AArc-xg1-1]
MSIDRYASEPDHPAVGTDFETDLKRVVSVVTGGIDSVQEEADDAADLMNNIAPHVEAMNDQLDGEEVPNDEQIVAAWFFLLQFASQ